MTTLDANAGLRWKNIEGGVDVQNVFDAKYREVNFANESRLAYEPAPVTGIHYTPGWPRTVMVTRRRLLGLTLAGSARAAGLRTRPAVLMSPSGGSAAPTPKARETLAEQWRKSSRGSMPFRHTVPCDAKRSLLRGAGRRSARRYVVRRRNTEGRRFRHQACVGRVELAAAA